jgi:hypothetical protein
VRSALSQWTGRPRFSTPQDLPSLAKSRPPPPARMLLSGCGIASDKTGSAAGFKPYNLSSAASLYKRWIQPDSALFESGPLCPNESMRAHSRGYAGSTNTEGPPKRALLRGCGRVVPQRSAAPGGRSSCEGMRSRSLAPGSGIAGSCRFGPRAGRPSREMWPVTLETASNSDSNNGPIVPVAIVPSYSRSWRVPCMLYWHRGEPRLLSASNTTDTGHEE